MMKGPWCLRRTIETQLYTAAMVAQLCAASGCQAAYLFAQNLDRALRENSGEK